MIERTQRCGSIRIRAAMRLSRFIPVVVCFAAGPLGALEIPDPSIHDSIDYHDISGATEAALVAELKRNASTSSSGDRFAANTRWRLTWNFRVESADGPCRVASVATDLDIQMTLPRWNAPSTASPALVKRWNAFTTALRKHEDGHRDIAVAAAHALAERAGKATPASDCDALKRSVGRIADDTLREYRDKESSYDVTTLHGRTQGATFP